VKFPARKELLSVKKFLYALGMAFVPAVTAVMPVFAQIDPSDPLYEPVGGVTMAGAIETLYDIGVLPVIAVAAVLTLAVLIYKRFRR
jgi:hypothetical protein